MSTCENSGCVVLLIDESTGMTAVMGGAGTDGKDSKKTNSERTATALNSFLNQLTSGPDFDVALIGYQTDDSGQAVVQSRWGGALAGREFVNVSELAAAPLRVETRTRKIPMPGGFGAVREEAVQFPIWYAATPTGKAPQIAAFNYCRELIERWSATAGSNPAVPIVLHVSSSSSSDGNPQMAIQKLIDFKTPLGTPVVLQAHLAATPSAISSLYPSSAAYLTTGSARDMFRRASLLPAALITALKNEKVSIGNAARGLIHNAKIADLVRLLGVLKIHVKDWPVTQSAPTAIVETPPLQPEPVLVDATTFGSSTTVVETISAESNLIPTDDAPTPPPADVGSDAVELEKASLFVFVLDRSVADPYSGDMHNPLVKLQDHANDLLKQISKWKGDEGTIDAAIVSYGLDSSGFAEIRTTFDGPLTGQTIVAHSALADGAIRVEECKEEVSNGIGGIIEVNRKKPIFFDVEPTTAAAPLDAFHAVANIVRDWSAQHPQAWLPPVVVHLTRGSANPDEIESGAAAIQSCTAAGGPAVLYHLVATESPHKSLAYVDVNLEIEGPSLQKLWDVTSPLLARERIAADRTNISAQARGFVVNGKFDLLLEALKKQAEPQQV